MKKALLMSLVLMLSIALAGSASANHFDNLVLTANCDGWSATGGVVAGGDSILIKYTIELFDGTTLIEQHTATNLFFYSDLTFNYGEMWSSELCGEYTVNGVFELIVVPNFFIMQEEVTTSFICDCPPPPDVCTGTPGYWKNHSDVWPVDELVVGGTTFSKGDLLDIFRTPSKNDKNLIKLFHHLVAAKLNVLMGATYEDIDDAIATANDFLDMYPLGTKLDKATRRMIDGLKAPLVMFNESSPCGEETIDSYESENSMYGASPDENQKVMSWGAIKSAYKE
ncbi:hypothetical protein J7M07_05820 [bacterium]|nr:hypothetical protein [bacterium]